MKNALLKLISDFNVEPLARYLGNLPEWNRSLITISPYGHVYPALAGTQDCHQWASFIWTLPQHIIPSFSSAYNLEDVDHAKILLEVDAFSDAVVAASINQYVFVASWVLPPSYRGYGMLDWKAGIGMRNLLARMNLRLADRFSSASNVYFLDSELWLYNVLQPESPKMWYAAKVPYSSAVFENAAIDIASAVEALKGHSRRLIILDLDNTLWGGVVGETGWRGIRLGGHDHLGEAYKDFQRELKSLSMRGIQLAIVSKNDESVAFEVIDKHPEMLLRRSDFAGWKINWQDKANNILALSQELNLGLGSMVFIDDNPVERDRVAVALEQLLVPEWTLDPTKSVLSLRALKCFNAASMSIEDRQRKGTYVANRTRTEMLQEAGSQDDWLQRLKTSVRVTNVSESNISRVAQLFNKTNQLNLSTRRMSEGEILEWANTPNHRMLAVSVSDCFGDLGVVGIVGVEVNKKQGKLVDYVLSCRVMGRKIEETLIHVAVSELAKMGASIVNICYLPTPRNRPTLGVFRHVNLAEPAEYYFTIDTANGFPKPPPIQLVMGDD